MRNVKKIILLLFFIVPHLLCFAGVSAFGQPSGTLDNYIKQGLRNNLALKQKELSLEKSLKALQEANGLFYPSVGLEAQYFLADGGRSIDLPVGDMLNPVYTSLNEILAGMGRQGNFPQISNEKIQFLPSDYHDTKLRVIMPLINSEIYYNRKIKKEMINAAQAEVNVFKRELIKEIKIAYYRYLQTLKIVEAYKSALDLVNEARRVNAKLVENQMAGPEKLYRIEAEQSKVKAELTKAESDRNTASSYFNFLLNQPLQNQIQTDTTLLNLSMSPESAIYQEAVFKREEISQIESGIRSTEYYYKLRRSYFLPVISNITDIGYQGYSYTFSGEQQYIMNTVNLTWPLFNGFQNRNKAAQARIESETLKTKKSEIELQIELQSSVAEEIFQSTLLEELSNLSALTSSKAYYKVVSKQYGAGQKSLLDLLDARNQLTNSQISYHVSHFESLIRYAELERTTASIDLDMYNNY